MTHALGAQGMELALQGEFDKEIASDSINM